MIKSTSRSLRRHVEGFTLVEILIVVAILGILASIVIPQFTSASEQSRENSVKMTLFRVRQQIEIYRSQHNGNLPTDFTQQMTLPTTPKGVTSETPSASYALGPYIREVPPNPFTGGNEVSNGEIGASDWYYNPANGEFRANNSETHFQY